MTSPQNIEKKKSITKIYYAVKFLQTSESSLFIKTPDTVLHAGWRLRFPAWCLVNIGNQEWDCCLLVKMILRQSGQVVQARKQWPRNAAGGLGPTMDNP